MYKKAFFEGVLSFFLSWDTSAWTANNCWTKWPVVAVGILEHNPTDAVTSLTSRPSNCTPSWCDHSRSWSDTLTPLDKPFHFPSRYYSPTSPSGSRLKWLASSARVCLLLPSELQSVTKHLCRLIPHAAGEDTILTPRKMKSMRAESCAKMLYPSINLWNLKWNKLHSLK